MNLRVLQILYTFTPDFYSRLKRKYSSPVSDVPEVGGKLKSAGGQRAVRKQIQTLSDAAAGTRCGLGQQPAVPQGLGNLLRTTASLLQTPGTLHSSCPAQQARHTGAHSSTVRGQETWKDRGESPTIRTYLRRADLPGLASRLIIHQELLPVPSFCTRMNLLCSDKLWRMEFCEQKEWHNLHSKIQRSDILILINYLTILDSPWL